jgi:hypothetical protein
MAVVDGRAVDARADGRAVTVQIAWHTRRIDTQMIPMMMRREVIIARFPPSNRSASVHFAA